MSRAMRSAFSTSLDVTWHHLNRDTDRCLLKVLLANCTLQSEIALTLRSEAIAIRLETIASRLEAIAIN